MSSNISTTLAVDSDSKNLAASRLDTQIVRKPYLVIEQGSGWRSLRLAEVSEFRYLIFSLAMLDVKLVYKQTLLGLLWVVPQPLIGAGIFTFVFGMLANKPSCKLPYFAFSFAGMVGWSCSPRLLAAPLW